MTEKKRKKQELAATDCSPEENVQEVTEEEGESTQGRREFLVKAGIGAVAVAAAMALPSAALSDTEVKAFAKKVVERGEPQYGAQLTCDRGYGTDSNCVAAHCAENYCPLDYSYLECGDGSYCQMGFCRVDYCMNDHDYCLLSVSCAVEHCVTGHCQKEYTYHDCTQPNNTCYVEFCASAYCDTSNDTCTMNVNICQSHYCSAGNCPNTVGSCPTGYGYC